MTRLIVAAMLFAASSFANAFVPASGLWYNPNESGRGFNIEIQNNAMGVASYVYDTQGNPLWYTSAGTFDESAETFTANFDLTVGGQCLGCPYVSPHTTVGAPMSIVFTSYETATLYFEGGSTPIEHFNFGYAGQAGYLQGEWAFSLGGGGLISSQWIVFNGTYTGSNGTVYQRGTGDGDASVIALGGFLPSSDQFLVVIDDGTGFTFTYQLAGDNTRMLGVGWIETTGTTISGPGSVSIASRILSPAQIGRIAPAKAATAGPAQPMSAPSPIEGISARLRLLEAVFQARSHTIN